MHSPDIKAHIPKKTTNLRDKKKSMQEHLFKGTVVSSSPKSAGSGSRLMTSNSDIRTANRFEEHSMSFNKAASHLNIQINHQSKTDSFIKPSASFTMAGELASPRSHNGNPILQNGEEKTQQWKPIAKRSGTSYKTSIFSDDYLDQSRAKAKGQFNDEARKAAGESPARKTGIRIIQQRDSPCLDESPKRQLKLVNGSPEKSRNPITEGEADKQVRTRVTEQQVSEWTQKANQKGAWLPTDRVGSSPGRVRLEKPSQVKALFEQSSTPLARSSTPGYSDALRAKKCGNVGELFNHSHYDDSKLKVTAKCSEASYSTIKNNLNVEKTYSRVKVDIHV